MQAGQREAGVVVVEGRIRPQDRIVTGITGLWEAGGDVVRHGAPQSLGVVPIGGVAGIAGGAGNVVVVADVALIAIRGGTRGGHLVVASERPVRGAVSPRSGCERGGRRVAVGAIGGGESGSRSGVHGIVRPVVVGLMAIRVRATVRSSQRVTASGSRMTLRTLNGGVQAGQREAGSIVAKGRVGPIDRVVAGIASLWEAGGDVIRNVPTEGGGAVPLCGVAGIASRVGGSEIVVVVGVAARTGSRRMRAGERPAGDCVVEGVIGPGDCIVAGGAIRCRKSGTCSSVRRVVGLLPSR